LSKKSSQSSCLLASHPRASFQLVPAFITAILLRPVSIVSRVLASTKKMSEKLVVLNC
jgi:hypothetical protein